MYFPFLELVYIIIVLVNRTFAKIDLGRYSRFISCNFYVLHVYELSNHLTTIPVAVGFFGWGGKSCNDFPLRSLHILSLNDVARYVQGLTTGVKDLYTKEQLYTVIDMKKLYCLLF